jgi:O-antigen/teichoic acid export membrane protein
MRRSVGRVILGWMCGFLFALALSESGVHSTQLSGTFLLWAIVASGALIAMLTVGLVRDRAGRWRAPAELRSTRAQPASAWTISVPRVVPASDQRRAGSRSERRQFVAHNVIATTGSILAGLLGFGLQALMSHTLHPADYGKAFAVFTFFILITQPAGAFSRLMAWTTSRELATTGGDAASSALLRSAELPLLAVGAVLAGACCAGAGALAGYLHVPTGYIYMSAIGTPFMLAAPALLGGLQGEQRFPAWGVLSAFIAGSRVVCVGALVVPLGVTGVLLGISVASALTYALGLGLSWRRLRRGHGRAQWRPVTRFLSVSIVAALCLSVMLGSDALLVEHLFPARQGGEFGSVVAISRAVFFAMGGATSVLFPKVVARHASGHRTAEVVVASLGMALAGGVVAMLLFDWEGKLILHVFAGRGYTAGASYMGLYALGMGLLAAANMLMNTQQSLDRLWLIWILLPLTALKPVLILLFHDTLLTVVVVSDIATLVFLVGLTLLYVAHERDWGKRSASTVLPAVPIAL